MDSLSLALIGIAIYLLVAKAFYKFIVNACKKEMEELTEKTIKTLVRVAILWPVIPLLVYLVVNAKSKSK